MKKLKYLSSILILSGLLFACETNIPNGPEVKNLRELNVPTDFNWSNAHSTDFTVTLQNSGEIDTEGRIMQLMDEESRIIQITTVQEGKASFKSEIPNSIARLIIYFPATGTRQEFDNIAGLGNLSIDLGGVVEPKGKSHFKDEEVGNCDEGCDRTVSDNVSYLEVKKDETVCLTGVLSGGLKINSGGTLRICGKAEIQWTDIKSKNKTTILVTQDGSITSRSFYLPGADHTLINEGTITLENWLDVKGQVVNYGTMSVNGLGVPANGFFDNVGNFTCHGEVDVKGTLTNYEGGKFTQTKGNSVSINSQGTIENYCQFFVGKNLNLGNGYLNNYGYLRIEAWFYANTNQDVQLGHQSMIHVTNFQPNCSLVCKDGGAAIKVDGKTNIDSKTTFTGWIDICDETGIDNIWTRSGELPENVTSCDLYIPVNGCSPVGLGKPDIQDADEDGIVDDEDEFPNDPKRAFSVLEPYAGYKLWAFEDLWPSTGDYDFNDVVISTRIEYVYNAKMIPVEAEVEVRINALGAGVSNGLAMQFIGDKIQDNQIIESVEGSSAKLDPDVKNSIILADDIMANLSSKYNNNGIGPRKDPEVWSFKIIIDQDKANSSSLQSDFFIFRTDDRGHEIHIAGNAATSAADKAIFGTSDDYSDPEEGYWYKTINGIPWGLSLITIDEEWSHPVEKTSILEAYPSFEAWATSGGQANNDWHRKGVYGKCFHK